MRPRTVLILALMAVAAGCDSSDPVAPQVDVDAALAQIASGAMAYGDFGVTTSPEVPAASASSCDFDAPSGFFLCAPVTAKGLTFTRRFQLLDASGAPLGSVNPLLVASIRSVIDVEGNVEFSETNAPTLHVTRHDDATLSGIQSADRVLDGRATTEVVASANTNSLTINDTTVTSALHLPATPQQKYPLGGTVVTSGAWFSNDDTPEQYRIEVLFDGTSIVTVTSTFGTDTTSCKLNLATSSSTCS